MKYLRDYFVTCSCNLTMLFQLQNWPVAWVGWPWQTSSMDMEGNLCGLFQGMPTGRVFISSDLSVPIVTAEQPVSCAGGPAEYGRRWSWGMQLLRSVSVLSFRFFWKCSSVIIQKLNILGDAGGGVAARNFALIWQPKSRGLIPDRRRRYFIL